MTKFRRDLEDLVRSMWNDFTVTKRRRTNHYAVELRNGNRKTIVFMSSTPSDWRAIRNFESKLRKAVQELRE